MKKILVAATVLATVALGGTAMAASGHPHFIRNATSVSLSGAKLVVHFKEAGLASGSIETITVSATEAVTYECVNGGGMNPAASNKHTFVTTVSQSGTFTANKNGNVIGTLTLSPATAKSLGFTCPPGQTVVFVSVTYSNITITDETSGATISLNGTFTYKNPDAPAVRRGL